MPRQSRRRKRLNRRPPFVIGLTGSIAMGKSTAAAAARFLGVPVFDADAAVHQLLGPKGAARAAVGRAFPNVMGARGIDRKALGDLVFADKKALRALEAIVHPLVQRESARFFRSSRARRARAVVLDIPLLFERGGERTCDAVMVVSAPAFLQRQRVLRRSGMTPAKFAGIRASQVPDAKKRHLADIVIPSGIGKRETLRRIARF